MQAPRRPCYHPVDSLHLFLRVEGSVGLLLSDKRILAWLKALWSGSQGYEKYLSQYPAVLCAPLDLHYLFRRAACTLDEELLQDLLFSFGWREANWGAWLAALAPLERYVVHLQRRRPALPHGSVVIDLALAACAAGKVPGELAEHWSLLCRLRGQVEQLPRVVSPLRTGLTIDDEAALQAEVSAVRAAYRQDGEAGARRALAKQQRLSHVHRSHLDWARVAGFPRVAEHLGASPPGTTRSEPG